VAYLIPIVAIPFILVWGLLLPSVLEEEKPNPELKTYFWALSAICVSLAAWAFLFTRLEYR